jgi:hypothetical protein
MADPHGPIQAEPPSAPPTGWRFGLGVTLFTVGLVCPVFIPVLGLLDLPAAWMATLSGFFALGLPELLWLAAAVVLGKEGFARLKAALWGIVKRHALPQTPGPIRYRIGLVLFAAPLLVGWLVPYFSDLVPGYEENRVALSVAGDVTFLISLLVLGGDFWDKLRSLFVIDARAQFPRS